MSCHGCATKFGLFGKEHGCPGCGFAFCSKCLRYKRVIPKLGPDMKTVCRFCFIGVPDAAKKAEVIEPPAAYIRRLEALENPAKPPIVVYKTDSKMEQLKSGLAEEDRDIVQRLEKLREDRKKKRIPTEEEIRNRLAALKEASADVEGAVDAKRAASAQFVPDTRSDEEKSDALLNQLIDEQVLDEKNYSTDAEIAERLAKLRAGDERVKGAEKDKAAGEDKDSDEDNTDIDTPSDELEDPPSDAEADRLLQRLMKEAAEKVAEKKARRRAKAGDVSGESDISDISDDSAAPDSSNPREVRKTYINLSTFEKKLERELTKLGNVIRKPSPHKINWIPDTHFDGHTKVYVDEGNEGDDETEGPETMEKWWEFDNDSEIDWKGTSEELEEEESSFDLEEKEHDPTMCFICQEIPTVKCIDCNRLYCDDDNLYFHKIPPYADHKTVAHEADKKSSPKKDADE